MITKVTPSVHGGVVREPTNEYASMLEGSTDFKSTAPLTGYELPK
jgi:hypothetical protein